MTVPNVFRGGYPVKIKETEFCLFLEVFLVIKIKIYGTKSCFLTTHPHVQAFTKTNRNTHKNMVLSEMNHDKQ